ncbi:hypothetical protein C6P42_003703 [Pichia californica]|nr:hypothetical protein C6P42_003703 [[Candida] californica]
MFEEEYDNDDENFERIATMHIKRGKYAIYKLCMNNFKLNNSEIYQHNKSSTIFHLKVSDMIVTPIEINIYILKKKIVNEDYKYWESIILDSLKISNKLYKKNFDNSHNMKNIIKLSYPVDTSQSEVESDDELDSESDYDADNVSHFSKNIEKELPIVRDNHIGQFYKDFLKNRKVNNVFILNNSDFTNENATYPLNLSKNKKRKKKSELSIPLIELKESDMDDWSCPKFDIQNDNNLIY